MARARKRQTMERRGRSRSVKHNDQYYKYVYNAIFAFVGWSSRLPRLRNGAGDAEAGVRGDPVRRGAHHHPSFEQCDDLELQSNSIPGLSIQLA